MSERETIDRGWYYVVEPDGGVHAPESARIVADDGAVLTRRLHGYPARVEVVDETGGTLPVAAWLRAAAAVGHALEGLGKARVGGPVPEVRVTLRGGAGAHVAVGRAEDGRLDVVLDAAWVGGAAVHHAVEAAVCEALMGALGDGPAPARDPSGDEGALPGIPMPRALFFESLMNTDMPHNDQEISQGVLHMVSPLRGSGTEVVLVNAKMPIVGDERPVLGLERLHAALAEGDVQLVGITLLEGYWEGVCRLIQTVRAAGSRARIAVGGVMPTLAPEHVAAHLPEVSFVCRGAGEVFVPALARILGSSTVDDPFTPAQRRALLALDGILAVDRAGGRLLAGNPATTAEVTDLDRVTLDLSHVQPRHVRAGIEIVTSRGCIYRCSFCSILGRESYQARSAGSVFDLLGAYEARLHELFPDGLPPDCHRVHIADDDFACDRDRARAFFEHLGQTPWRLTSVQVAVGDLCVREGGRLLAVPDTTFLDAIRPELFADHHRPIPLSDHYADHASRDWSSFLQIGVETYNDREIARLGKGYKRVHIRTVVAELARRELHMDGYFILSNAETSPLDLVEVFEEVARLKLRCPKHFHLRFPVVQHLVSYFTAASHRRHLRRGRRHVMKLRGHAAVPGFPELDYPFVDHDEPLDPWVAATVATSPVTDEGLYTGSLEVLHASWRARLDALPADHPDVQRVGPLARRLHGARRRLAFEVLRDALQGVDAEAWPSLTLDKDTVAATVERVLGAAPTWLPLFRHAMVRPADAPLFVDVAAPIAVLRAVAAAVEAAGSGGVALIGSAPEAAWQAAVDALHGLDVSVVDAPAGVRGAARRAWKAPDAEAAEEVVTVDAAAPTASLPALAAVPSHACATLAPVGAWTARAASDLGEALFGAARARRVRRVRAGEVGSGAEVIVDVSGAAGLLSAWHPGVPLARANRGGDATGWVRADALVLEVLDHALRHDRLDLEGRRRDQAAFDKVLRSFLAWQGRATDAAERA